MNKNVALASSMRVPAVSVVVLAIIAVLLMGLIFTVSAQADVFADVQGGFDEIRVRLLTVVTSVALLSATIILIALPVMAIASPRSVSRSIAALVIVVVGVILINIFPQLLTTLTGFFGVSGS